MNKSSRRAPQAVPPNASPVAEAQVGRRGGNLYFAASVLAQMVALARYVALARLLGPEQLGLAATLVVTGAFFDLVSETGSDRFLIQDREGESPAVQSLVQLVYAGRGLLIAASLIIFSGPIAGFYKEPHLAIGLCFLAIAPLITGFLHLDVRRLQRRQDFRSEAISLLAGESASLIATVTAAYLTHDFTAILYGLITRAVVLVAVSHLRAERPYSLGYSREHAPRLTRFALPLVLTGVMLFIGSQGDRVVVANRLGLKSLGQYSAVLLLIYSPAAILLKYVHGLYVPLVAAARDDSARRNAVSNELGGQTLLLAICMAFGFAVVAPTMVPILYGHRYRETALVVGLIGVLQTTRYLVVWPTTIALSIGRSRTVLVSNLVRLLAYPGAFVGVWLFGGLTGVVTGFITGELTSVAIAMMLVNRDTAQPAWTGFDRLAVFVLSGACIVCGEIAAERRSWSLGAAVAVGVALVIYRMATRERQSVIDSVAIVRQFSGQMRRRFLRF